MNRGNLPNYSANFSFGWLNMKTRLDNFQTCYTEMRPRLLENIYAQHLCDIFLNSVLLLTSFMFLNNVNVKWQYLH